VLIMARNETECARVTRPTHRSLSLMDAELQLAGGELAAARRRLSDWCGDDPHPAWTAVVEASILLAEGRPASAAAAVAPYLTGTSSLAWSVQAGVLL
jgi:LuxR family maltose regulon positive regulatory protein